MNLRRVETSDLVKLSTCNLNNIPENYIMRYWLYIVSTWPELSFLAEDDTGKVVGYVLSSIESEEVSPYAEVGCINSLSVLRPYRRLGIAQRLMNLSKDAILREYHEIDSIQLQVRRSNMVAQSLYKKLGYVKLRIVPNYYPEEDAFIMRLELRPPQQPNADTRSLTRGKWTSNLWYLIHDRPQQIAQATMSLLRRNSHP